MPRKPTAKNERPTQKQEAFARKYVETGNASEAYRFAYNAQNMADNSINVNASKLLNETKVALRVEELQEKAQKRHDITVDKAASMYLEAYQGAKGDGDHGSCIRATDSLVKLFGLKPASKHDVTLGIHTVSATERLKQALGTISSNADDE